jgi:hypothetical protein
MKNNPFGCQAASCHAFAVTKKFDVFLMTDYINSCKRKKLNNRRTCEMFSFYYREDMLKNTDVCRKPLGILS